LFTLDRLELNKLSAELIPGMNFILLSPVNLGRAKSFSSLIGSIP